MGAVLELPPGLKRKQYQFDAVDAVFGQWEGGINSTLLLMPTGTGKTVTAALVAQRGQDDGGWRTLFLAQRRKLVTQAASTFQMFGFLTAIEMADLREREQAVIMGEPEVVVGTVQTLTGHRLRSMRKDRFDLVVIDEAHHALGPNYQEIIDHFSFARLLGITATPDGSKRNLGDSFETIAYRLTLKRAIQEGALCPLTIRTIPVPIDLTKLRLTKSDFNETEIAARLGPMLEPLAYNIKLNIADRQAIVFTPDLGTASLMASMLRSLGIKAKYVAGTQGEFGMREDERDEILAEFDRGEFQVIVSCDLLTEGYDCPRVSCIAICRPTQARYKYVQMVGRGLRLFPEKEDLLVLDFDWQTDETSKRLCTPYVLFAETTDEETLDALDRKYRERKKARQDAGDADPFDWEPTEEIQEEQKKRYVRELVVSFTGKFARRYEGLDHDPVGVSRIVGQKFDKWFDMSPQRGGGPASNAQVELLRSMGLHSPDGLSKWGASKMLDKLLRRRKQGLASFQQVKRLLAAGVREDQARSMSAREAAKVITDVLIKQGKMSKETFF
jgi:superfamily II DNA or RNA helicase